MRPMKENTIVLHFENDPKRISVLETMEIMKATTSDHMRNVMQNKPALPNTPTTSGSENDQHGRILMMPYNL